MAKPADAKGRPGQVACSICAMNPLCHPDAPDAAGLPCVERRVRLAPGEVLFSAGDRQANVYAVHAGFLKDVAPGHGAGVHIVRFLLPGDAVGLDSLGGGVHTTEAVALGDCEVCEIPAWRAEILADSRKPVAAHLRGLLARELAESRAHSAALATLSAPQRVAAFLLETAGRWQERGYSPRDFRLPMSRREIAGHLSLTIETVSRILSDFRARGWVRTAGRAVEILDAEALRRCLATAP